MEQGFTISRIVYDVYTPFMIAVIGVVSPIVGILLSVFSQGRQQVTKFYELEIQKITDDIKTNETTKKHWVISLLIKLMQKRYRLIILTPSYYLPLLIVPPVLSLTFSVIGIYYYQKAFLLVSLILLLIFVIFLIDMVSMIAKITETHDAEKEQRDRALLETLQGILKNSDPSNSVIKDSCISINGMKVRGVEAKLNSVILGKEVSYKISFVNIGKTLPAKKVEVGIQFPLSSFEIKEESGYSVYAPENIVRFQQEYVAPGTDLVFPSALIFTPKITGEHKVTTWVKGENIETKYTELLLKVEMGI